MLKLLLFVTFTASLMANWECTDPKKEKIYNSSLDDSDLFKKCQKTPFFSGELLYWNVLESPTDYALKMTEPARNSSNNLLANGNFQKATFDWDFGYRLCFGYFNAPKYWEVKGQYTWLYSSGNNYVNRPSQNLFVTGTFPQYLTSPIEHADSHIQLHYHVGDLLADRVFLPNPHLRLRLFGGISGAFFNQKWRVRYLDSTVNTTTITQNWTFDGVGLRMGTSFDWFWGKDFYISALVSLATVIGKYKNQATTITSENITGSDNVNAPFGKSRYKDYRVCLHTQMYVGPSYQRSFPNYRFEIFAGYELNAWANLFEVFRSTQDSSFQTKQSLINRGLLALTGLSLRMTLNF